MKSIFPAILILCSYVVASSQGTYPVFANLADHNIHYDGKLLGALGDRLLYFNRVSDKNKLWVSDGTESGTKLISPADQADMYLIYKGTDEWYFAEQRGTQHSISRFTITSDTLERIYSNGIRFGSIQFWQGKFAWIQNSAGSGYSRLQLYDPATSTLTTLVNETYLQVHAVGKSDTHLYFIQSDDDSRKWLGKSDGTMANTATFKELFGITNSFDQHTRFFSDGEKVFFFFNPETDPYYLWTTDGTAAGTIQLEAYDYPSFGWEEDPGIFHNGKFYFMIREEGAPSGSTIELHASNGTPAGTVPLNASEDDYLQPRRLTVFNNKVYFISELNYAGDLRSTQGTVATTNLVLNAYGHQSGGVGFIYDLGTYNNSLVIQAYTSALGEELYLNDGTSTGTTLLADVIRGEEGSLPRNFVQVGDRLFFTVDFAGRNRLWVYDPAYIHSCDSFHVDSVHLVHITDTTTGAAHLFPSLGQQPFVYSLNGADGTYNNTFTNLAAGVYEVDITDNQGCTIEYTFEIEEITGLGDSPALSLFSVAPNPVSASEIQVGIILNSSFVSETVQLEVYSQDGQIVHQQVIGLTSDHIHANVSTQDLRPGMYVLSLRAGDRVLGNRKVVVK